MTQRLVVFCALLSSFAGCFKVDIPDGELKCSAHGECPRGYLCIDALCHADHDDLSGSIGADGPSTGDGGTVGKSTGDDCAAASDCDSKFCVDGVCCESACDGSCTSCNVSAATKGMCKPIPDGTVPAGIHPACGTTAPPTCGNTGICDGQGACTKWFDNTCAAASCNAGVETAPSKCDGKGTCQPGAVGGACTSGCNTDSDCSGKSSTLIYCNAGTGGNECLSTKEQGLPCNGDGECTSNHCTNGACCGTATCGTCESCGNAEGTCLPVVVGADDPQGGCLKDDSKCQAGGCDGSGACLPASPGTPCSSLCTASTLDHGQYDASALLVTTCTGTASSTPEKSQCTTLLSSGTCGNYLCASTTACATACTGDNECAQGSWCSAGSCTTRADVGSACAVDDACASRICEGKFCVECDSDYECRPKAPTCDATTHKCTATCPQTYPTFGVCSSNMATCQKSTDCVQGTAPMCNTTGLCSCDAAGTVCATGQVCVGQKCLVETTFPCVVDADCGSGTCTGNVCASTHFGGTCSQWDPNGTKYKDDCGVDSNCCLAGTCGTSTSCGP